ncbi:uncharacterized protein LOC128093595 [Culex pipiens pallens]|uniref:uncharacterized protein LOC128093595 n=1 Tax=Culex pipiens pallens TaxID=42434 RepID=UPI0022AAEC14|nr:uncharacterized protein LOC128093595 [Culex pipiens pallens]
MRQDNYAAFISDGHNNLEQLPALMQDCLAKVHGTIEDKAFQVIQCLWASRTFKKCYAWVAFSHSQHTCGFGFGNRNLGHHGKLRKRTCRSDHSSESLTQCTDTGH